MVGSAAHWIHRQELNRGREEFPVAARALSEYILTNEVGIIEQCNDSMQAALPSFEEIARQHGVRALQLVTKEEVA